MAYIIGENIMASLAEIRAKLQSMESKPGSSPAQSDKAIYPFLGSYLTQIQITRSFG